MRRLLSIAGIVVLLSACGGGGSSLEEDVRTWCVDNFDAVDDAAGDLGLLDLVDVYYEDEGDGIGPDGEPNPTERNVEVSQELRRRNDDDPDALFDDLVDRYFDHPDGEQACTAAYEDND